MFPGSYLGAMKTIFQQLMEVEGDSLFLEMVKAAISTGRPIRAIRMIIDQTKTQSERDGLIKIIGEDLLKSVEQFVADVKSIANEKE